MGPSEAAYLRGGRRASVTVALVALELRGAVAAGHQGTVRVAGQLNGSSEPLQVAVHKSLHRPVGVRILASRARVGRALDELRDRLAGAGLLRTNRRRRLARGTLAAALGTLVWGLMSAPMTASNPRSQVVASAVLVVPIVALWLVPRRTRAGRRAVQALRERFPLPADADPGAAYREGWSQEDIVMAVALHGDRALLAAVPHFARDGGLLGRGGSSDGLGAPRSGSGGGSGLGASCGTAAG